MVTAKMKVGRLTVFQYGDDKETPTAAEIEMIPDYAAGKNSDWASATPSAVFRMTVNNPKAIAPFVEAHKKNQGITATFSFDE